MIRPLFKGILSSVLMMLLGVGVGVTTLYGWQYLQRPSSVSEMETSAHFASTNKNLVIYTASWCQYCQKVKNYLNQHQVAFEDRDIESTDPLIQQLYQTLGAEGVPQILIGNKIIRGADLTALELELKNQQLL